MLHNGVLLISTIGSKQTLLVFCLLFVVMGIKELFYYTKENYILLVSYQIIQANKKKRIMFHPIAKLIEIQQQKNNQTIQIPSEIITILDLVLFIKKKKTRLMVSLYFL